MEQYPMRRIPRESYQDDLLLSRLLELHQIPQEIFVQGNLPTITLDDYGRALPRILTIVGSRKHSSYGNIVLQKLLGELQGYPVVIVSGLAQGIDTLSHQYALLHNLPTLAIPGSGLDNRVLYPHSNRGLKNKILEAHGALLSELPPETQAAPWTFPQRNRIMAALSDAVLIVEAQEKSGTLITARLALELGRDIGAVPGEIFSKNANGTNTLIRDGAYPITCIDDLLELLHLSKREGAALTENYTVEETVLLTILSEGICNKDDLLTRSQLPFEVFISAFSSLEIKGVIHESLGEVRTLV